MCMTRDIAKVLSGMAFVEIINHTVLTVQNLLPLHFFGLIITPTYNLILLFSWIIVGAFSVYYGWIKKQDTFFKNLAHKFTK